MASIQLEIDIHSVRSALEEARRRGIDPSNPTGRRHDALVHHNVAARADDSKITDAPVARDGDFQGGGELGRPNDAGRLIPHTEETVVDVFMVSAERAFAGSTRGTGCAPRIS